MDLDHRARHAAANLRHEVDLDLDLDRAQATFRRRSARRRARHQAVRGGGAVLVAVAAVVGMVALAAGDGDGRRDGEIRAGGIDGRELSASGAAIMNELPQSPIDGKASWRLPVVADPQSDVADGDTITLYGKGFAPHDYVGIVMCVREAEIEGVGGCQLGTAEEPYRFVTYADALADGSVVGEVVVRRFIDTPATGPVDCKSEAERCLIAIGATTDYDRSGGSYIDFAGAPPFPEPSMAVDPAGPYTPGQQVEVRGTDLIPSRLYKVEQCRDEICASLAQGPVAADGTFGATVAVNSVVPQADDDPVACDDRCTLRINGVGPEGASSVPFPDPVPLAFLPGDPAPVSTTQPPGPSSAPEVLPIPGEVPATSASTTTGSTESTTTPATTGSTTAPSTDPTTGPTVTDDGSSPTTTKPGS